jgi:SHS2 domain-containing protein
MNLHRVTIKFSSHFTLFILLFFIIIKLMISSYIILEHPADIGIEAKGKTLKDAVEAASIGLSFIMVNTENIDCNENKQIELEAIDEEALIIKWLNEILFYFDSESFICKKVSIFDLKKIGDIFKITGSLSGERFSSGKHEIKRHVKAVTYHQFELIESGSGVALRIFFDI